MIHILPKNPGAEKLFSKHVSVHDGQKRPEEEHNVISEKNYMNWGYRPSFLQYIRTIREGKLQGKTKFR